MYGVSDAIMLSAEEAIGYVFLGPFHSWVTFISNIIFKHEVSIQMLENDFIFFDFSSVDPKMGK